MNKEKLLKGGMWLFLFVTSVVFEAVFLSVGFNYSKQGSSVLLIVSIGLLPLVFFFLYKGFKFILDSIF